MAAAAAIVNAADLPGIADRAGTLEPGKGADLIAVGADPLADVRVLKQVRYVVQGGQAVR